MFVLDSYSFENYYCTIEAFKKIFFREFGVGYNSEEMNYFSKEYLTWCKKLEPNYLIINQCFYIMRLMRKKDVSLDKILKRHLMSYDQATGILTVNSISYEDVATLLGVETFTQEEIEEAASFFVDKDLIYYGRGHNQIWVTEAFLKSLYRKNALHKLRIGEKMIRFNCHRDVSDEIVAHCEYAAEKPEALINFIKNASEEVRLKEIGLLLSGDVAEKEIDNVS